MSNIDVMAAMDSASINLFEVGRPADGRKLDAARAAVAELIDASEAFYEAQTNMDNREYIGVNAEPHHKLQARLHDARRDFEAALFRVRGAE